ncbi:unnamed protein product [Diplocarpon coronariae]
MSVQSTSGRGRNWFANDFANANSSTISTFAGSGSGIGPTSLTSQDTRNSQKFRNGLAVTPTLHTSVLGVIGMSIQTSGARLVTPCTDPMISFVPTMISPRKRSPHLKSTTGPAAVTSIVVNTIVSFSSTHPRLTVS